MATITQKLGARIKKLRKKVGLTQEELAVKARIDLTTISEIESGNRNPSVRTVNKIALALKISISDLFRF